MHQADILRYTEEVEIKLSGKSSWKLAEDVTILHTPGHTAGSICVLVKVKGGENALFSGDHLAYSASRRGLDGFKRYNKGNEMVQGILFACWRGMISSSNGLSLAMAGCFALPVTKREQKQSLRLRKFLMRRMRV